MNTAPSYVLPPVPDVATGTGPDRLVLSMAEDFYSDDARFTVAIDGVAQPGIFKAIAPNAKGQTQNFLFYGTYAPGAHAVTVTYLNTYYGGAPYLSRQLYFRGMTYNTLPILTAEPCALHRGDQTMSFTAP